MTIMGKLDDYPALRRWCEERARQSNENLALAETLVVRTCEAMSAGDVESIRRWLNDFDAFLRHSPMPLRDFLAAEEIFHRNDAALLDVIGEFGEAAVRQGLADGFLAAMRSGADATGLLVLRFLAAWTALNSSDLETCIAECEKVDEPFAALYTVHGQALADLRRLPEAVDVLSVAVKLAPGEILAWFQLAKTQHALGRRDAAWNALIECKKLAPQSDEVAIFMALVALEAPRSPERLHISWHALRPHLSRHATNGLVTATLFKLGAAQGDKERVRSLLTEIDWGRIYKEGSLTSEVASLLRIFQEQNWMDLAGEFLKLLVPEAHMQIS